MPNIIDLLKKNKISIAIGKYHLTNEEIDKVYELYIKINQILNEEFSEEEKKEYMTVSRNRLLERILEDLVDSVRNKKEFMINDFTMDYLLNKVPKTLLQFTSNFHFLVGQNNLNRMNEYYSLEHFIEYLYKRACNDNDYLQKLNDDQYFSIIINNYQKNYQKLLEFNEPILIKIYNQMIGLLWYNEMLEQESIIDKIGNYLYNNNEDLISRFSEYTILGDEVLADEYDNLLDDIMNNKVKRLDGDYDE
ncbi:MAG: hypothetical protein J6X02_04385 [Bacilli bacterium]|nr:hypothetical protein [Bacilli bacterium]